MFWDILKGDGVRISDDSPTNNEPARVALAVADTGSASNSRHLPQRTSRSGRGDQWRQRRTSAIMGSPEYSMPGGETGRLNDRSGKSRAHRGEPPFGQAGVSADPSTQPLTKLLS
jgi:hypothetical protein